MSYLDNVNKLPVENADSPIDEKLRLTYTEGMTDEDRAALTDEGKKGLLENAADAVKDLFDEGYNALMGTPGADSNTYAGFRATIFATDEYKDLDDAAKEAQLQANLKASILKAIGPMKHGQRITAFMGGNVDNQILFGILKVLKAKQDQIQPIMKNLAGIDKKLYDYVREGGEFADNQNVRDLVEALIDLQANALFALLEKETVTKEGEIVTIETEVEKKFFNELIIDIKNKIVEVNKLLGVKSPGERVGLDQQGGYRNSRDEIKYMKYKAKYLKLKSRLQ